MDAATIIRLALTGQLPPHLRGAFLRQYKRAAGCSRCHARTTPHSLVFLDSSGLLTNPIHALDLISALDDLFVVCIPCFDLGLPEPTTLPF